MQLYSVTVKNYVIKFQLLAEILLITKGLHLDIFFWGKFWQKLVTMGPSAGYYDGPLG